MYQRQINQNIIYKIQNIFMLKLQQYTQIVNIQIFQTVFKYLFNFSYLQSNIGFTFFVLCISICFINKLQIYHGLIRKML